MTLRNPVVRGVAFVLLCLTLGAGYQAEEGLETAIVYRDSTNRLGQICTTNAVVQTCLTSGSHENWGPLWSPDRKHIAFFSNRTGVPELYVVDAEGHNVKQLTTLQTRDVLMGYMWEPSGERLFIETARPVGHDYRTTIYLTSTNGETCLLFSQAHEMDLAPTCELPLHTRLLFNEISHEAIDIFSIGPESLAPVRLTHATNEAYSGILSPDGNYIAFLYLPSLEDTDSGTQLYVMRADGTERRYVADLGVDMRRSSAPYRWSPDSTRIAFTAHWEGDSRVSVNVVDIRSFAIRQITDGETRAILGDWSPDGQQIVFSHLPTSFSSWEMVVVNADGTAPRVVAECGTRECQPDWSASVP